MEKVVVPKTQYNVETNLKFSSNKKKFGPPPATVRIGHVLEIEFENPKSLLTVGVHCDPRVISLLIENVPGFKRIVDKGQEYGCKNKHKL